MAEQLVIQEQMVPGFRVDRESKTIFDVCLLGPKSRNGWKYSQQVIAEAAPRYARKPVYLNHAPSGGKRNVQDIAGRIASPRLKDDRLYGDIKCIGKNGDMLLELAESDVDGIGMSHLTDNTSLVDEKTKTVKKIGNIKSVDLVDDPATTKTLKEENTLELKEQFEPILAGKKDAIERLKAVYELTGVEFKLEEQVLPEVPKLTIKNVDELRALAGDHPVIAQLIEQYDGLQRKEWARAVIAEHKIPDNEKTLKALLRFDSKEAMGEQAVVLKEAIEAYNPDPGKPAPRQAGRTGAANTLTVDSLISAIKG